MRSGRAIMLAFSTVTAALPVIDADQPTTIARSDGPPSADGIFSALSNSDTCGDSSFENHSSTGSPSVSDCQQLVDYYSWYTGGWTIADINIPGGTPGCHSNGEWCEITRAGTCQFSVIKNVGFVNTILGSSEVRDLIRDSIARFSWNGLVGAEGYVYCKTASQWHWAIYHT